jgi:hypothetical protein
VPPDEEAPGLATPGELLVPALDELLVPAMDELLVPSVELLVPSVELLVPSVELLVPLTVELLVPVSVELLVPATDESLLLVDGEALVMSCAAAARVAHLALQHALNGNTAPFAPTIVPPKSAARAGQALD